MNTNSNNTNNMNSNNYNSSNNKKNNKKDNNVQGGLRHVRVGVRRLLVAVELPLIHIHSNINDSISLISI